MKKQVICKSNSTSETFRQSAQSLLLTSKHNAIGTFIRRLKGRKGSAIVVKAGTRKIDEVYYNGFKQRY